MKTLSEQLKTERNLLLHIHEKVSSWTAHLIGPFVFDIGMKEKPWNMSTADLLKFPEGSTGKALGDFLSSNRLELIAGAESHDLYHLLFGFSTTFRDEVALQFFLRGNGKRSIASFGVSIGAWFILPGQWSYLRASFARGKKSVDVSTLNAKALLDENFAWVMASLKNSDDLQMHNAQHVKKAIANDEQL